MPTTIEQGIKESIDKAVALLQEVGDFTQVIRDVTEMKTNHLPHIHDRLGHLDNRFGHLENRFGELENGLKKVVNNQMEIRAMLIQILGRAGR